MEDAEGVLAEGSMGLAMLERRSLFELVALGPLSGCWWLGGVDVVEVPRWRQEVPEGSWKVEGVVAVGLVGRGSQNRRCLST